MTPTFAGLRTLGKRAFRYRRSQRTWVRGWDSVADTCPPDPGASPKPPREAGKCGGEAWIQAHADKDRAIRAARQAGYLVRHRWPRAPVPCEVCRGVGQRIHGRRRAVSCDRCAGRGTETRQAGPYRIPRIVYVGGPAAGCEAVDPWSAARILRSCSRAWRLDLYAGQGPELAVVAAPQMCSRAHWCPVCAPRVSAELAASVRTVIPDDALRDGEVYMMTLTHRDAAEETLLAALTRFRRAWERVTRGRCGRSLVAWVNGTYYGLEVTRGGRPLDARGRPDRSHPGRWWHAHAHVIVWIRPTLDAEHARLWWRDAWIRATEAAAVEAGVPGHGWDPVSGEHSEHDWRPAEDGGGVRCSRCRRPPGSPAPCVAWWIPVRTPAELYQACKYPTPLVDLHPIHLAEFLAVAHGRRWHQGTGVLRSVRSLADALTDPIGPDELRRISACGPGDAPPLEEIARDVGRELRPDDPEVPGVAAWRLTEDGEEIREAIRRAGGEVATDAREEDIAHGVTRGPRAYLPRTRAGALARRFERLQREKRDAAARFDAKTTAEK